VVGHALGLIVKGISMRGGDPNGAVFFTGFDRPVQDLMTDDPDRAG
jgi:hypothetical protein